MWTKRTRALVLLTLQNASISLLTRQSRLGDAADLYLPSVAVLCTEVSCIEPNLQHSHTDGVLLIIHFALFLPIIIGKLAC